MKTVRLQDYGFELMHSNQKMGKPLAVLPRLRVPDSIQKNRISLLTLTYEKWLKFYLSAKYGISDDIFINEIINKQSDIYAAKRVEKIGTTELKNVLKYLTENRNVTTLESPDTKTVIYFMYLASAYSYWKYGIERIVGDGSVDFNEIEFLKRLFSYTANIDLESFGITDIRIGSKIDEIVKIKGVETHIIDQIEIECLDSNGRLSILQPSLATHPNLTKHYLKGYGYSKFKQNISGVTVINPRLGIFQFLSFPKA